MTKYFKIPAIIVVFATFATGSVALAQSAGLAQSTGLAHSVGLADSAGPLLFAQTAPAKAKFEKVNMDMGGGVFEPVLRITPPTGEPIIIRVGEHGLTRTVLFNSKQLRAYGLSFLKAQKG